MASDGDGEAWLAIDQILARPVIVKLLPPDWAADADLLGRFRAEARLASSVEHPNLARIFDYNDPVGEQPPYLVMELVPGESVAGRLVGGPLPVTATLDVLAQVAAGMDAAYQTGLVRLNVAAGNVVITDDGIVKVTEFGIGGTADTTADLRSLGTLARECLRGQSERIPAEVMTLITELTDSDLTGRPASAAEVAERAAALREQLEPPVVPVRWSWAEVARRPVEAGSGAGASAARQPSRGRLLLIPVAAVIAVAAGFFVAGHLDRGGRSAQNEIDTGNPTVQVNGAAFRDQPVKAVDRRLLRMGFSVRNRWRPSASVPAGLVISVSPTGRLPLGSLVTVLGSGAAQGPGRVMTSSPRPDRHRKRMHSPGPSPSSQVSHSPKASSPASPKPAPTPTPSPSEPGVPTPTPTSSPTQAPTGSPAPSGSPSSDPGAPAPTESSSPSPAPS